MAKVTFKIPKKAFEDAADQGDFETAPPGLYVAKLTSCEQHYAKGDGGKPDKKRPSLECIWQIVGVGREGEKSPVRYSQIWDYVSQRDSEDVHWKQAQFAAAMGLGDGSKNVNVTKDTEEFVGTLALIRVKKDKSQDGEPRAKISWMGPNEGDEADAFEEAEGDEAEGDEEAFEDGEAVGEEDDTLYDADDLKAMDRDEFKALCEQYEIKVKGKKKSELIDLVLEAQQAAIEEEGDDGDDDDEPF